MLPPAALHEQIVASLSETCRFDVTARKNVNESCVEPLKASEGQRTLAHHL